MARAFADLHCHSKGSFDCLSDPRQMMQTAVSHGLTHLAITDHDRIDVALKARDAAPEGLTVIVGEEVKTLDGDLICLFLERAIEPGASAADTIAAAREQGAPGRHPAPVRSHARVAAARRGDGEPRRRRSIGSRRTTRASSAMGMRTPRSSRASTTCPVSQCRMRIRSWRSASPTPRSMETRRRRTACSPLFARPRSSPAGPVSTSGPGRRSQSWSIAPAETAGSVRRAPRPTRREPIERNDRERHGRTGPSTGGGRAARCGIVRSPGYVEHPSAPHSHARSPLARRGDGRGR